MGANPTVIGNWFKLLKDIEDTAGIISPDQIWSGDETGIQNVPKEVKVLGMKHIRTFQQVSSEQGETSTILSFVSAGGKVCPPLVIHKGQRVQETWRLKAPWRHSTVSDNKRVHHEKSIPLIRCALYKVSEERRTGE